MSRRCSWCDRPLRWWQPRDCRRCGRALAMDDPSPPFHVRSQRDAAPDRVLQPRR